MYFANCYHHSGKPHEVVMDVILGTWTRIDHPDHITFGCRFDVVDGRTVATLVEPVFGRSGAPIDGRLISKAEAPTTTNSAAAAQFRSRSTAFRDTRNALLRGTPFQDHALSRPCGIARSHVSAR